MVFLMPIPMTAKLPKPRSAEEFEDMTTDALRCRWKDPHAARHGRSGQQQHGVDIIGRPHWLNGRLGVAQCKNTDRVTLTAVLAEVRAAMLFPGEIGEFLFCTTADRDAILQNEVRGHFEANPAPFRVEMVFWLDILGDLAGDSDLVVKYWGLHAHPTTRDTLAKLEAELREAFERAERLNTGLHNRFWEQHIDYDFRPDRVERFYDAVSDAVSEREFLVSCVVQGS